LDSTIIGLGQALAGCYDNREQALSEPIWYVSLQAWWRPVPLFAEDSVTLFAEQANVLNADRPYRQRLMRIHAPEGKLQAQFYQFAQPGAVLGAGANADLVAAIVQAEITLLPGCVLPIQVLSNGFSGKPNPGDCCRFGFPGGDGGEKVGQVELGFEVRPGQWHSYDKGINPETGQAIWGALMGPYRFTQRQAYGLA
jgi:CpeT/CpcT family (DUF1001)